MDIQQAHTVATTTRNKKKNKTRQFTELSMPTPCLTHPWCNPGYPHKPIHYQHFNWEEGEEMGRGWGKREGGGGEGMESRVEKKQKKEGGGGEWRKGGRGWGKGEGGGGGEGMESREEEKQKKEGGRGEWRKWRSGWCIGACTVKQFKEGCWYKAKWLHPVVYSPLHPT